MMQRWLCQKGALKGRPGRMSRPYAIVDPLSFQLGCYHRSKANSRGNNVQTNDG